MPQFVVKSGTRAGQTIELMPGTYRFGRHPENDYSFEDTSISTYHCEVVVTQEGTVRVEDKGSTNGSFVEGRSIREETLTGGQTLRLGAVEMTFEDTPVRIAIPSLSAPALDTALPEGVAACFHHPDLPATMECTQCHRTFCEPCVHRIQRVGGIPLLLCPSCSGHCRRLTTAREEKKRKSRLSEWIGKVTAKLTGRLPR